MINIRHRYAIFSSLCLLLIPLIYINNAYFDLTVSKFRAMLLVATPVLAGILLITVISVLRKDTAIVRGINSIDISVSAFALIALVSCILSGNFKAAFFGSRGWWVGAATYITLALIYFYLSRNIDGSIGLWLPVFAVNMILMMFGICQFAGLDILGLSEGIHPKQYYQYIATYGNTNWYTGYLCLVFPMASVFFISAKSRFSYIFNLIFIALSASNMLIIITDGLYIGLIVCIAFAVPFIFENKQRLERAILVALIFSEEALIIELLPCNDALIERATGISALALDIRISALCLAVSLCLYIIIRRYMGDYKRLSKSLKYISLCIVLSVIFVSLIYSIITFSDAFGSHRGLIWRASLDRFSTFDIKEKIFGIGTDMLRGRYKDVEVVFEGLAVISSHSEPIQALLTMGIFGLASWVMIVVAVVFTFYKVIRRREGNDTERLYSFFLPIIAYYSQSLVNSATTVNLCLITVVFSYFTCECSRDA